MSLERTDNSFETIASVIRMKRIRQFTGHKSGHVWDVADIRGRQIW
jgi:hypothetical protein